MNRRTATSLAIGMLSPVGAWLGGYDFDHRGFEALMTGIGFLFLATACYTFPGWYVNK